MTGHQGARTFYLFVGIAFGLGLWAGATKAFGMGPVVTGGIMIVLGGLSLLIATFRRGDHYERQYRGRISMMAVAFMLIGAGYASPSFPISMALQLMGIALMIAIWLRVPKRLFAADGHRP